jgi:hypothetical protein
MRRTRYVALALAAACAAVLVACMGDQQSPLAPQSASLQSPLTQAQASLHPGGPQANDTISYFICHGNGGPYTGSAVIGPLGGRVVFGPHELDVPPAALLVPTTITAQTVPGDTIAVQFQPQGLTFLLPATLQLSYAQCNPQPTETLSIVYVDNLLDELLGLVESIMDPGAHKVIGLISHFSVYAIAE